MLLILQVVVGSTVKTFLKIVVYCSSQLLKWFLVNHFAGLQTFYTDCVDCVIDVWKSFVLKLILE